MVPGSAECAPNSQPTRGPMPLFSGLRPRPPRILRRIGKFRRQTSGGVAAIVAILSPVFIGAMGLGSEAGYWYLTQRKVQNAADVAAHAAAVRLNQGDEFGSLQGLAEYVVGNSDVDITLTNVALNNPPVNGGYIEDNEAVEVVLTRTVPRMFSSIYGEGDISITARAVAAVQDASQACVLALNPTANGAITVTGNGASMLTLCDFVANSTASDAFEMSGASATAMANCVRTGGEAVTTFGLTVACASLQENASPVPDPFAAVDEPQATGACQDGDVGQNNQFTQVTAVESHTSGMSAMRFCNGLSVRGTVDFAPGLYIVEGGDFQMNSNAIVTGDDVVFFLADGVEARFNGTATSTLSAPTTGTYQGILIFSSRDSDSETHLINGNFGTTLDGAIYAAASEISMSGNAQTSFTGCTQIVGDTVEFSGNGFMNLHCLFPQGPVAQAGGGVTVVE